MGRMKDLGEELKRETLKWLERAEKRIKTLKAEEVRGKKFLENVNAYIQDSRWFLEKGDLVRAFECVVWAWAWIEIGEDTGILSESSFESQRYSENQSYSENRKTETKK